jgi:hypothetical protein
VAQAEGVEFAERGDGVLPQRHHFLEEHRHLNTIQCTHFGLLHNIKWI